MMAINALNNQQVENKTLVVKLADTDAEYGKASAVPPTVLIQCCFTSVSLHLCTYSLRTVCSYYCSLTLTFMLYYL